MNPGTVRAWIGRSDQRKDQITAASVRGLWATLNREGACPEAGAALPALWHWLYFTPAARQDQLGVDGHPLLGGFLPPIRLPRRMWAGGRVEFNQPLHVGDEVTRESRIVDLTIKQGRSGDLVFVTVRHEIGNTRGLAISEVQNIVYRGEAQSGVLPLAAEKAPTNEAFSRNVVPDPVLLFRYSALTFNAHRIHYDRPYALAVEGYPGLVVQGPLIATLLIELLQHHKPDAVLRRFSFKSVSPLFDTHPFSLCGRAEGCHDFALWARTGEGAIAMQATAELA